MGSVSANIPRMPLEIHGKGVSSVVVHHIPEDRVDRFLEWQKGISRAADGFPGYQGTEIYPPTDALQRTWVAVVHFDDKESMQRWIDSPIRAEWTEKFEKDLGDFQLKLLPGGFGAWFAGLASAPDAPPPPLWKMAVVVLLGLYPVVMLLAIFVGPYLSPLGLAVSMLLSNILSVVICQWGVTPVIISQISPWLNANSSKDRAFSIGGLIVSVLVLAGLAILFRMVAD